ncbi:4-(cytidine 5'-diphospho)-2-C-methyl-D-erythritol kinase [Deinococcus sonorensis]|uniref:4-diphosphocytidyl-2-C-methyl-D-erythritol kinase n=2 Tax=Deinococcus sonorensis TaxID=309891 RepID=A0AAU7U944_9DEIO
MTRYFAPAKINLGLSVLDQRSDGYHSLHSLMVPLSIGDELEVRAADQLTLQVEGAALSAGPDNLVYRAARAYLDAAGLQQGAEIVLHKQLPLASGLGGGSSDAATTLMALARLYPAGVDLRPLAERLGADVPFFLLGQAALAEGIGERLTPLAVQRLQVVLVNPGVAVSAADAYRWLDEEEGYTPPLDLDRMLASFGQLEQPGEAGQAPILNALQPPVSARHPEIAEALTALREAGLHAPLMSGSGSTCFALAASADQALTAAEQLARQYPAWWIQAAHTVSSPLIQGL